MPRRRSGRKKVVDKWKTKEWYSVISPQPFENQVVGEVISSNPENLINRIVRVNLMDITGKMSQRDIYTTILFRIKNVEGKNAYTEIIGHELAPSYVRMLARKRRSVIHHVIPVTTKDGKKLRIKIVAVTAAKISSTLKKNVRHALVDAVIKNASQMNYHDLMREIIYGNFASKLFAVANAITAMRNVEIRKTELEEVFT